MDNFTQLINRIGLPRLAAMAVVAILMLGFFGKLNWKWVATGIGVSFALAIVPTAIGWLDRIGGGNG